MKNRKKELKGFVVGLFVAVLLSATTIMASPVMRELVFGVSVSIDGQAIQFEEDMRPFIIEGRTFLPVRAIADAVGLDVDFDPTTNTVLLMTPISTATRLADTFFAYASTNTQAANFARVQETSNMLGVTHYNVVQFGSFGTNTITADHNLDGNYSRLTGIFGRGTAVDTVDTVVRIIGDGSVMLTFELGANDMSRDIDLDVSGVQLLRVEVRSPNAPGGPGGVNRQWVLSADLK